MNLLTKVVVKHTKIDQQQVTGYVRSKSATGKIIVISNKGGTMQCINNSNAPLNLNDVVTVLNSASPMIIAKRNFSHNTVRERF
jgi:aspartyl/asparaginyl-tRNA synthetase